MFDESEIKTGIKNPKEALEFLILGRYKYNILHNATDSCIGIKQTSNALESRMVLPTDIHEHLATLHMLTVEFNLKNILELGTRKGESTLALLSAAKEIGGRVTSIDINPCTEAHRLVKNHNLESFWTFIQSDDITMEWKEQIDHLFIDTSHKYQHTLNELIKFEPLVRNGGIISMHDIILYPEVYSAIKDYLKSRDDIRFYKYFNNNGLAILRKK